MDQRLNDWKKEHGWAPVPSLIVGTSGGAINALFYALGQSSPLADAWKTFDQYDLIRPSVVTRVLLGTALGLSLVFLAVGIVTLVKKGPLSRFWAAGLAAVVLAVLTVGIMFYSHAYSPNMWVALWPAALLSLWIVAKVLYFGIGKVLGDRFHWSQVAIFVLILLGAALVWASQIQIVTRRSHWYFHSILLLEFTTWFAIFWLVAAAVLLAKFGRASQAEWITKATSWIMLSAAFLLLAFSALAVNLLGHEQYVTDTRGVKLKLLEELHNLFPSIASKATDKKNDNVPDRRSDDVELQSLSNEVVSHQGILQHDLIITASRLPSDSKQKPDGCRDAADADTLDEDLYFYFNADRSAADLPSASDRRFISLRENPDKLMSVVVGSGTIYPFFGSQPLECLKVGRGNDGPPLVGRVNIVDGGFLHNSPIDAARSWGATHILLIDASPTPVHNPPVNFLGHALNAFDYLFDQAQRDDRRARQNFYVYELSPADECATGEDDACAKTVPAWLDIVDFSGPWLKYAVEKGIKDVYPKYLHGQGVLHPNATIIRLPGAPVWINEH